MVKITVLQHAPSHHLPSRPGDAAPTARNLDPNMHPFARARERARALNAAKLDRIFAKPFIDSLEGHADAVEVLVRKPGELSVVASGGWDGGIVLHNLALREQWLQFPNAHKGKVSGLCFTRNDQLLSCGVDRNVKLWDVRSPRDEIHNESSSHSSPLPLNVFPGKSAFNSIDHHRSDPLFATASALVQIWDETKSAPISNLTFSTSTETITSVKFNLSESSVLASVGSDRTFTLYDIRTGKAERRVIMQMRINALAWCPTHPTTALLASEDHQLYTFDIRRLSSPKDIYKGHVAPATSCDWSPTGREFASGGWDRTVRIWNEGRGTGSEVYHTKRMQRVTSVVYTADAKFVVSGSDDGNVRLWKAKAAEKLGVVNSRERAVIEYRESLKARWAVDGAVGKILRTRHLPKPVYKATQLKRTMIDAARVKEERRRKHSRAGEVKPKPDRKKVVIVEQS